MSRTNRRSSRPIRLRPRERYSPAPNYREAYPVRVKSHDGYIECAPSLLTEISGEAQEKPRPPLHLKLEIGGGFLGRERSIDCGLPFGMEADEITGVLMGRKEESRLLILAFRRAGAQPVRQAEINRPENWERAFGGLVARVRWDPKLSGMQPVGWFRAGSQTSCNLSERDLEIFNRFFPEPWQVGLVLKSEPGKIGARFFHREQDRSIDTRNGFQDVVVRRDPEGLRPAAPLRAATSRYLPAESRQNERSSRWWPVAAVLAVGLGASWMLWRTPPAPSVTSQTPVPAPDLNQQASDQAATLWKQWEAEARQRAEALSQPPPQPPEAVEPELAKNNNDGRERRVSVPPIQPESSRWPANVKERLAAIRNQIHSSAKQEQKTPAPERTVLSAPSSASAAVPPPASPTRPDTSKTLSTPPVPSDEDARLPAPPPAPEGDGRRLPQTEAPPAALPAVSTVPVHPTPQPPSPTATATVPRSGRLIWTGRLHKNDYLVFDGGKPSAGSATGALPGKPVELTVSPGDLTKNGLVVYTARLPKPGGTEESPGPQNGWNKTVYEWDPARTTDFEVVEAPSASNSWKRLVLRVRNPKHSIVMVEWKAQP